MEYTLKYHPSFRDEDIPKLDEAVAVRVRKAMETKLLTAPERYGSPLRRTLKGYWKLRVGDHRIVFRVKSKEVFILGILHRKKIYGMVEKDGT